MFDYADYFYDDEPEAAVQNVRAASDTVDPDLIGGPHSHCFRCHSFTLCSRTTAPVPSPDGDDDEDSCDFAECPLGCGHVFHGCKVEEHLELCPNKEVPCINMGYGCPFTMSRKGLGSHLESCPASVVICTAEWNRWPLHSADRKKHIPFRQLNPYAKVGQLDYDLALRDQRMLKCLETLPRVTKVALRNNLTKIHPAVPLPPNVGLKLPGVAADAQDPNPDHHNSLDEMGDGMTFLGIRRESRLSKQMQQWKDDLDTRLKGKVRPPKYWEFPELEKGNIHKHCAYCVDADCTKEHLLTGSADSACHIMDCRWGCGAKYHSCKSTEHSMICASYEEPDEYEWMYKGVSGYSRSRSNAMSKKSKKDASKAELVDKKASPSIGDLFFGPGEPAFKPLNLKAVGGGKKIPAAPPAPRKGFLKDNDALRLDYRLETETRLQSKPKAIYTFVCAQQFRRDEYHWHCKNVHDDIIGGINNWMERRCPMASYGCGFSVRAMYPNLETRDHPCQEPLTPATMLAVKRAKTKSSLEAGPNFSLAFNPVSESFCTRSSRSYLKEKDKSKQPATSAGKAKAPSPSLSLENMPYEVLFQIFLHTDSVTLYNLSLTCKSLRSVCCSVLDTRGCVSFRWHRVLVDGKIKWEVAYKQWFFSSAMTPIRSWTFWQQESVSEHLKSCPYNVRTNHSKSNFKDPNYDKVLASLTSCFEQRRPSKQRFLVFVDDDAPVRVYV